MQLHYIAVNGWGDAVLLVSVTYISWSIEFSQHHKYYFVYVYHNAVIVWADTHYNLILIVGQCDLNFMPSDLANISNTVLWLCIILGQWFRLTL